MIESDWTVHADWKPTRLLVDEAYAHPAKFNYGLITAIIAHGLAEGYWRPGGWVEVTPEVRAQIMADLEGGQGGVDAIVTSPPFSDCERGGTGVVKHSSDCGCNWCRKNRGNAGSIQGGKWGAHALGQIGQLKPGNLNDIMDK